MQALMERAHLSELTNHWLIFKLREPYLSKGKEKKNKRCKLGLHEPHPCHRLGLL
jgi:hypothetical protein